MLQQNPQAVSANTDLTLRCDAIAMSLLGYNLLKVTGLGAVLAAGSVQPLRQAPAHADKPAR